MTVSDDPNVEPEDVDTTGDDTTGDEGDKKDWREEFEGQKKVNRDLERKMKKDFTRVQQLETENAKLREGTKGATEPSSQPDLEKVRSEAKAEAAAEMLRDRVLDKVETKAAKLFADPEDARALLAAQVDDFIDGQQLDLDAIDQALEELLKKKPHLAAATARRFQGGADGGARKGSTGPAQLTDQDLKRMTPQQIEDARVKGQLNDLLGVS